MYIYIYICIYDRGSIYEISLWRRACFCDAISSIFHNFSNRWRKKGRTRRRNTIPETASRVSFLFCSFSRDISKVWLCEMKNSFNTSKSETSRLCTFSISTSMLAFFNSCCDRPARCLVSGAGGNVSARGKKTRKICV